MSWDDITENAAKGSMFTELKSGQPVVVHIMGEPEPKFKHWQKGTKTPIDCVGNGCTYCKDGVQLSRRWHVKVFNMSNQRAETLQAGISVFKPIRNIRKAMGGSLKDVDLQIEKSGSGLNTEYAVVSIPTQFKPTMIIDEPEEATPF